MTNTDTRPNAALDDDLADTRGLRCLELRMAGWSFAAIAAEVGYHDKSGAKKAYERALAEWRDDLANDVATHRAEQLMRIERIIRSLWPRAIDRNDPEHLAYVDRVNRQLERQARLLGLDAPVKVTVSDETDQEIETLLETMAELERKHALREAGTS